MDITVKKNRHQRFYKGKCLMLRRCPVTWKSVPNSVKPADAAPQCSITELTRTYFQYRNIYDVVQTIGDHMGKAMSF